MNNKKATSVHIRSIFYDCSSEGMQDDTLLQANWLFWTIFYFANHCRQLSHSILGKYLITFNNLIHNCIIVMLSDQIRNHEIQRDTGF